jgi:hypothetical protein
MGMPTDNDVAKAVLILAGVALVWVGLAVFSVALVHLARWLVGC